MTSDLLDQDASSCSDNGSPGPAQHDGRPSPATSPRPAKNARILRLPQVCSVTGYGRSMIYQLEAARRFPSRIKLGARAVGWTEGEVQEWLQQRIDDSRSGKAAAR